jgi:hypothetical protein
LLILTISMAAAPTFTLRRYVRYRPLMPNLAFHRKRIDRQALRGLLMLPSAFAGSKATVKHSCRCSATRDNFSYFAATVYAKLSQLSVINSSDSCSDGFTW